MLFYCELSEGKEVWPSMLEFCFILSFSNMKNISDLYQNQELFSSLLDICSNPNGRVYFPLKSDKLANFALKSQPQDCENVECMEYSWNGGR